MQGEHIGASPVAQTVKNPPAMWETWVLSLGGEDPLGEGMATHSSILAWRCPWREEPGGLQSMGLVTTRVATPYQGVCCAELPTVTTEQLSTAQYLVGCRISPCSAAPNPLHLNSPFIEWAGGYISLVWKPYKWWLLHFAIYVWVFVIISDHVLLFLSWCNLDI